MHWYGTGQLRRIAEVVADGAASQAELRLHELLAEAGVTGWIANAQVLDEQGLIAVADLLFEAAKVIIEVDGWRTHRSRESFVQDRRRDRRLTVAGYRVLRFTWDDLISRPAQVIAEITQALRLDHRECLPEG
jgi:very-short-patch-repair endonuclease